MFMRTDIDHLWDHQQRFLLVGRSTVILSSRMCLCCVCDPFLSETCTVYVCGQLDHSITWLLASAYSFLLCTSVPIHLSPPRRSTWPVLLVSWAQHTNQWRAARITVPRCAHTESRGRSICKPYGLSVYRHLFYIYHLTSRSGCCYVVGYMAIKGGFCVVWGCQSTALAALGCARNTCKGTCNNRS